MGSQHADTGVGSSLVFHAGSNQRALGNHQRHSLTLHVGAHQSTVTVIVFQEGNAGSSHRNHHSRRDIHEIDLFTGKFLNVVAMTAGNARTDKAVVLVQRFVGLCHDVFIFNVGGHINNFIGNNAGSFIHAAVRCLNEAVLVDLGERCQIGDQTDVGTFGRLNRAQTAIVGIMNIADFEACAVTGQTAGAQSGQTALMGQLRQRVVLVHELRQWAGTDELTDGSHDRADVDQALRGDLAGFLVLQGHALAHNALHTGKADAELVLQQFANAAHAAVAQVVDFIGHADAMVKAQQVVDGSKDIVNGNGAADELIMILGQQFFLLFRIGGSIQNLTDFGEGSALVDAAFLHVKAEETLGIDTAVGEHDHIDRILALALHDNSNAGNTGVINFNSLFVADALALGGQQFAGQRGNDVLSSLIARNTAGQAQLVVHLEAAKTSQVVTARIKEQQVDVAAGAFHRRWLAGTQLAVALQQGFLCGMGDILFQGGVDFGFRIAEVLADLLIGAKPQCAQEGSNRQLAVFINAHIIYIGRIGFVFQPCAAVGVHGCGEKVLAGTVLAGSIEHAGRTNQLADDNTFCTVGDESAGIRHEREIAHENFLFLHFAGAFVQQARSDIKRRSIRCVTLFTFFNGIFGVLVQTVIDKFQREIPGVILDRVNVVEHFAQALVQEPVIRVFLDLDEVGHANHFVDAGKAHSGGSTVLYGLDLYHKMRPLLFRSDLFLAKALRRSNDFLGTFVVFNKV